MNILKKNEVTKAIIRMLGSKKTKKKTDEYLKKYFDILQELHLKYGMCATCNSYNCKNEKHTTTILPKQLNTEDVLKVVLKNLKGKNDEILL
jgi:GTPase SAR1 family protein